MLPYLKSASFYVAETSLSGSLCDGHLIFAGVCEIGGGVTGAVQGFDAYYVLTGLQSRIRPTLPT